MYQKFDVLQISANLKERTVFIETTMDVDAATVNTDTVFFANADDKRLLAYDLVVDGKTITIQLKDWPAPNKEHLLIIRQEIMSVSELNLSAAYQRSITFPSTITTTALITAPSNHERIEELSIAWLVQAGENSAPVSSFYLEIAKEAAFYNFIKTTEVYGRTSITLTDIPEGQYFVRIRAQGTEDYGPWSTPVSFLYQTSSSAAADYDAPQTDDSSPIVIDETLSATIIRTEERTTPTSFKFVFSKPIDVSKIAGLTVVRRDV